MATYKEYLNDADVAEVILRDDEHDEYAVDVLLLDGGYRTIYSSSIYEKALARFEREVFLKINP